MSYLSSLKPLLLPDQQPWVRFTHLGLAAVLLLTLGLLSGLALAGKVHFGATSIQQPNPDIKPASDANAKSTSERYKIEKLDDARDILLRSGRLSEGRFLGNLVAECFAFKYSGGLVECRFETETDGETNSAGVVPDEGFYRSALEAESIGVQGPPELRRKGHIVLIGMQPPMPINEELAPYQTHLGAFLGLANNGPLHTASVAHLHVNRLRNYRLFITSDPVEPGHTRPFEVGKGYWHRVHSPLVERDPIFEDTAVGVVKDIKPGVEMILVDKQRGYSRIRLRARFLGDGEARELFPK